MSGPTDDPTLDRCGCCGGIASDAVVHNAPSLPALSYRLGTHSRFFERMRQSIARVFPGPDAPRPLQRLTARSTDDPTIALLDAAAVVGDIITFYQERIANEGFLSTATERRSVLELARAIGYELSPGVAASVHLAFTVDEVPGSPPEASVTKGTQVQSVPPQDKLPQVFETSDTFVARPEWNVLRPRLSRPPELAILEVTPAAGGDARKTLHLLGAAGTFPAASTGLVTGLNPNDLFRLDSTEPSAEVMDAIPVTRIYLTEVQSAIAKGDLLLFAGAKAADFDTLILRVAEVAEEFTRRAGEDIRRLRVDLEALPTAAQPETRLIGEFKFHYLSAALPAFSSVQLGSLPFTMAALSTTLGTKAWRESDVRALIGMHGWQRGAVMRVFNRRVPGPPLIPEAGSFAFRETVGFFGHTAPRWSSLPSTNVKGNFYETPWDDNDVDAVASPPRTIWQTSQGGSLTAAGVDALLERPVKGMTARTWVVFEAAGEARAYTVHDAREMARADFAVSGRATGLQLRTADGAALQAGDKPTTFGFRQTTARVGSRRVAFAELPIETPIERGKSIELGSLVLGLSVGQPIVVAGEREDLRGIEAAEVATLAEVIHAGGRTTLILEEDLTNNYVRDTVTISANVVHATHGETVTEVVGSGNASTPNQRFPLRKPPLTYLSAPTPRGIESTLELRVNRVLWEEVPSLYEEGSSDESFVVRIDDDARAEVVFGDGVHGARVPSGSGNVTATYRSGIGVDGEVDARTLTILRSIPLGVRGVTNPVAASGAESPETLAAARRNAPLTVVTFERIVSLADFEDFGRTFPGIGKAAADRVSIDGRDAVHLTVAGATGGAPGPDVLANLITSMGEATDQSQRVEVGTFAQRFFTVHARLVIDRRRVAAEVMAAVTEALRAAFAFDRREFGQSVTPSEVIARIHEVEGVLAVDLEALSEYGGTDATGGTGAAGPAAGQPIAPLVSRRARWNPATRAFEPADLLLINPVGITLEEMS